MNAEEFFREFAGFEPDTPIGVEWVPFSSLKDACKAMEEYAAAKENEWNDEAVKPPCLPHLVGTGREQSDKVIAHGDGITFFAIYHHLHRGGVLAGLPERAFNRSRPTLFNRTDGIKTATTIYSKKSQSSQSCLSRRMVNNFLTQKN